jgi:hypothetical protein
VLPAPRRDPIADCILYIPVSDEDGSSDCVWSAIEPKGQIIGMAMSIQLKYHLRLTDKEFLVKIHYLAIDAEEQKGTDGPWEP